MKKTSTRNDILERYGARLTLEQLARLINLKVGTIRAQISQGRFPIPTLCDRSRRTADYRDVADYLDRQRAKAHMGVAA
ncbi:MAG: pyocin activator PrtN family protein [Azoarcus sp.]|jgi:hypothetical protein|nr:pyocin activator PrtN family protein [Azoarcus sp.]